MQTYSPYDIQMLEYNLNSCDWSDIDMKIKPLPSNQVYELKIADPSYLKLYQRFRVILQKQQNDSQRSYHICNWLLKLKTNNYYALMIKKQYIFGCLSKSQLKQSQQLLENQLQFANNLLGDNGKQYHIWTFKKDLLIKGFKNFKKQSNQNLQSIQSEFGKLIFNKEIKFISELLIQDCRNYHAWDYRFWIVTFFNKVKEELLSTKCLLFIKQNDKNFINQQMLKMMKQQGLYAQQMVINWQMVNSLWSHRFNLIKYNFAQIHQLQYALNDSDFNLIYTQIDTLVKFISLKKNQNYNSNRNNQCAWNYLYGFINFFDNMKLSNKQRQLFKSYVKMAIEYKLFIQKQDQNQQLDQINTINLILDNKQNIKRLNRFELVFLRKYVLNLYLSELDSLKALEISKNIIDHLKQIDPVRIKYYNYLSSS